MEYIKDYKLDTVIDLDGNTVVALRDKDSNNILVLGNRDEINQLILDLTIFLTDRKIR